MTLVINALSYIHGFREWSDWGEKGMRKGQTYRYPYRKPGIGSAMCSDIGIPSASWKFSVFVLHIWVWGSDCFCIVLVWLSLCFVFQYRWWWREVWLMTIAVLYRVEISGCKHPRRGNCVDIFCPLYEHFCTWTWQRLSFSPGSETLGFLIRPCSFQTTHIYSGLHPQ